MNSGTSDFLNASRWVAALAVVFYHVYNISVGDPQHVVHLSLVWRIVHFFSGFGHVAVIVFFVISGFLVGGRTILTSRNKGFNVLDYFIHRFSRIYLVLVPALVVGYGVDWAGINFCDSSGIYVHPDQFYTNQFGNDITDHLSLSIFIGNLMQLQEIIVPSLGSNGPLWSLANEWWYYVLFGFGVLAYRSGRLLTRVIAGGAVAVILIVLPPTISLWFVVWGIGAGVAVLDRHWTTWPFFVGATAAVLCLIAVRWLAARHVDAGIAGEFILDLAAALGYSLALVCAKNLKGRVKFWPAHRRLASFSYTVYLVHFPAMVFIAALLKEAFNIGFLREPSVTTMIYLGTLLLLIYGYAWIFAAFTEAHTDSVRSRLSHMVSASRQQANLLGRHMVFDRGQRRIGEG
jgi:peptidoglycan/LPS O-acetylase OafA/YrhL